MAATIHRVPVPIEGRDNLVTTLENEVQLLTNKATETADRLADYEEEIRQLKSSQNSRTDSPFEGSLPPPLSRQSSTTSRFSSFLIRSNSATKPLPMAPSSALNDLQAALARETQLRIAAERRVEATENELEDLSATLFEQANEMVATERKARAKLEERVRFLEERERERTGRMERIEAALARLERVKKLLDGKE